MEGLSYWESTCLKYQEKLETMLMQNFGGAKKSFSEDKISVFFFLGGGGESSRDVPLVG